MGFGWKFLCLVISLGESNAEEARLSELRRLVEECEAERILKESEISEMVESWRQTKIEIDSKDEQLAQMESELERYHAQVSAEMDRLRKLDQEAERKSKDLTLVQDKIAECEKLLEAQSSELVSKEKELEALSLDIGLSEQKVMSFNNDMKEACQRMETKGKELEYVQKLIEERSAQCESLKLLIEEHNEQLASAMIAPALPPVNSVLSLDVKLEEPISNSVASRSSPDVQQDITSSSHLPNEDAPLRDIEDSASLSLDEVFTELRMFKDPGRFVLTSVEQALTDPSERGELSLEEPILMPLVSLLEELARVGISADPDLQSDATKVADRWVEMMGASVEKSQLEAWAVLQFIVAFGLVKGTKQEQTLQLASYVAHFKYAPELFESLGLSHAIPNFVTELFGKGLYIPAIRLMFTFNVKNNFSPMELLKVQIINLRRSAKENRRYETQAEEANRDAATMMDIMELIEDFKLEIDMPVDLILKFMVPASSVPVQSTHMQASDTVIQSSCIATHGSNPSLPTSFGTEPYQAGGSTALLEGQQPSHHAGSKRPRVDRILDR
ncbi:FRIGIDA-like protein 5 [Raphanus sativus]|uniref:FRIGIDA-like protein n=1 Tax=Raphanus sativus TaxID=3726 RepID=A0A9W3CHV5_RAPSA|nr:FRIGIDA-like protein 5 [Raphanus sativus]